MLKAPFVLLCACVALTACKKSDTPSRPFFSYKVNDSEVQILGDRNSAETDPYTGYYFGNYVSRPGQSAYYVFSGADASDDILLSVLTSGQLEETTYMTGSVSGSLRYNGAVYGINNGDQISLTITQVSGTVRGNFSGTFSTSSGSRINVTDGKFGILHIYP